MTREGGFSLIETVLTIVLVGVVTTFAVSPIRDRLEREAVRGARTTAASHVARARAAASSRGCRAVLHLENQRVWVTTCAVNQAGGLDTVGTIDDFMQRFHVQLSANLDSIVFAPTGIMAAPSLLRIQLERAAIKDSLGISPTGRTLW